jgi:hypothetical protein
MEMTMSIGVFGSRTGSSSLGARAAVATVALSVLGLGCSSGAGGQEGSTSATNEPLAAAPSALPSDPNWPLGLTQDSIVFGTDSDGAPLYACRASYLGSIQVGKTRAGWSFCDFGHGGVERFSTDYQTLAAWWLSASGGVIPTGAVDFGNGAGPDPSVYVCRALLGGSVQVGKLRAGFSGCDVTFGGQEHFVASYDVLAAQAFPTIEPIAAPTLLGAIPGGTDVNGATLYPCFVSYAGSWEPGKTRADWSACVIGFGGHEIFAGAPYFITMPEMESASVVSPYKAGVDTDGSPLGICTASFNGSTQVGKYLGRTACSFGYGGKEVFAPPGFLAVGGNCCR